MDRVDLKQYTNFVDGVTSDASKVHNALINRLDNIDHTSDVHVSRLLTASIGLSGEVGEFNDIVKKVVFQEKELNDEVLIHLKKELGDVFWYAAQACLALNADPYDIINQNKQKLESRYKAGKFDAHSSENRKSGDI